MADTLELLAPVAERATRVDDVGAVPVVAPTAVDAYVCIESVRVDGRHRRDLGDIDSLAGSIRRLGMLLHPITLTPELGLISGYRRLDACRRLGWVEIPARFVDSLDDAVALLRAERLDDTERKQVLPSELAARGEALHAIAARSARQRQHRHIGERDDRGRVTSSSSNGGTGDRLANETVAVVAEALEMSRSSYAELRYVHRAATAEDSPAEVRAVAVSALEEMDRTGKIVPSACRVRARVRAHRKALEAKAAVTDEHADLWVPAGNDTSARAAGQRRHLIRHYAGRGYTSRQIGELVGLLDSTVRRIAREHGIEIGADVALGVRTRKGLDSNRIVRETAATLDGLVMGVGLVNVDALNAAEIDGWVRSLSASMRVLTGLIKQMKERTR